MRTLPIILFLSIILSNILLAQDFLLKTGNSGLSLATSTNGVAVADYDLDGDLDVYFVAIEQYDPQNEATWNRLFRNNGDKTFTDVTLEAGVLSKVNGYPWSGMGNKFGAEQASCVDVHRGFVAANPAGRRGADGGRLCRCEPQ